MIISIIVAHGKNNVIGKDNQLLWRLSADLKRFKSITMGHTMIMGRKTFESIGKPLPGRKTIIISRNESYHVEGCVTCTSLESAFSMCKNEKEVFVVGGAEIYKQSIDKADKLYLTLVDTKIEGDAYFPKINASDWKLTSEESFKSDEKNEHNYQFINYEKLV